MKTRAQREDLETMRPSALWTERTAMPSCLNVNVPLNDARRESR